MLIFFEDTGCPDSHFGLPPASLSFSSHPSLSALLFECAVPSCFLSRGGRCGQESDAPDGSLGGADHVVPPRWPVSSHPRAQPHTLKHVPQGWRSDTLCQTCLYRVRLAHRKNTDSCLLKVTAKAPYSPPPEAGPAFSQDQLQRWRLGPYRGLLFSKDGAPVPGTQSGLSCFPCVFGRPIVLAVKLLCTW